MPLQQLQHHPPTALLKTVFDFFITTKTLSELLDRPKDLCSLSASARSSLSFRCQLRKLEIHTGGLTEGLLKHMASGGFSDVTSIRFATRWNYYGRISPLPEHLKRLLRSASRRLSSLTCLELWSGGFAIEILQEFDPVVRARLQGLHLDPGRGSEAMLKSLSQDSPNLQALSLINMRDENHLPECLTHAFQTCKYLRTLDL